MHVKIFKWFKRIKSKGFTLVELLAVIVILAIILVIVVPKVFDAIDNSKTKSLVSSAKTLASSWEKEMVAGQLRGSTSLGDVTIEARCITSNEATSLGVSLDDYVINEDNSICSKVRKDDNGNIIVILYANPEGKLYNEKSALDGKMFASSGGETSKAEKVKYNEVFTDAKTVTTQISNNVPVRDGENVNANIIVKDTLTNSWRSITVDEALNLGLSVDEYVFSTERPVRDTGMAFSIFNNKKNNVLFVGQIIGLEQADEPSVSSVRLYNDDVQIILVSKKITSFGRLYVMSSGETGYIKVISAKSRIRGGDMMDEMS